MERINDKVIEKVSTVNCSLAKTWWMWTTREGLLTFFGLDNLVELRPGGPYEIYFLVENEPGLKGGEGNKVLSFVPEEMLSFTWNAPPQHPEIREHGHRTWVVLEFAAVDNRRTQVRLRHLGWLDGEQWDAVYDYFVAAWDHVMSSLKESCG